MKSSIICFSDNVLLGRCDNDVLGQIGKHLYKAGIFLQSTTVMSCQNKVYNINASEKNNHLFVIVLDDKQQAFVDFMSFLAKTYGIELKENLLAQKFFLQSHKSVQPDIRNTERLIYCLPSQCDFVATTNSSFLTTFFKVANNHFAVLPSTIDYDSLDKLMDIVKRKFEINTHVEVLKTFGITNSECALKISDIISNEKFVNISICENGLENEIILRSNQDNKSQLSNVMREIYARLAAYVYLENDLPSPKTVFSLLKSKKLTLSIAESVTGGEVASTLIKNNEGASEFIKEGIVCYSNESKQKSLGVSALTISKHTAVSSEVAYEMAAGMLNKAKTDLVVCTTGYASTADKPQNQGLCYIAIGDQNEIHIYKNYFYGTREHVISQVCQAVNYYLIKKLRKNDFHFLNNKL